MLLERASRRKSSRLKTRSLTNPRLSSAVSPVCSGSHSTHVRALTRCCDSLRKRATQGRRPRPAEFVHDHQDAARNACSSLCGDPKPQHQKWPQLLAKLPFNACWLPWSAPQHDAESEIATARLENQLQLQSTLACCALIWSPQRRAQGLLRAISSERLLRLAKQERQRSVKSLLDAAN